MKISYLLAGLGKTGGSLVLYRFMDELVRRGHEVCAVLPRMNKRWTADQSSRLDELIEEYRQEENKPLQTVSAYEKPDKVRYFEDRLKQTDPEHEYLIELKRLTESLISRWTPSDVTIATYCSTAYAAYALADRTVAMYHMQHYEEFFFRAMLPRLIVRNTYLLPLVRIANSVWLQNVLSRQLGQGSILVNPGIDLRTFGPRVDIEEKFVPKNNWTIVTYFDEGRTWKGFDDAVEAIAIARKKLKGTGLTIDWKVYGLREPQRKYATGFEYVGKVFGADLAQLYSQADIVLAPSWYESFPLPPLEAMACGSAVITTTYGTEDYVTDNENGLTVLPRKPEAMADRIVSAVTNPELCLRLVRNGLKTASRYSWEKRAEVLEQAIVNAIDAYRFERFRLFDDLSAGSFSEEMYRLFETGGKEGAAYEPSDS